jgi:hypothetical protein
MSNIINTGDTLEQGRQKINALYSTFSLWMSGASNSIIANNNTSSGPGGDYSIVGGNNVYLDSQTSFYYGQNSNITSFANNSFGLGLSNNSSSAISFIFGQDNNITTNSIISFVFGNNNLVRNASSSNFCMGSLNEITASDFSYAQGYNNNISNSDRATIKGDDNNISNSSHNSFIFSKSSSLNNAKRSVILGGQNINGTSDDTVYVPNLNIKTVNTNSSSSDVLVYNTTTKDVEKTSLPGSSIGNYEVWNQINGSPSIRTLVVNSSYIVNELSSPTVIYTLNLPTTASIGDSVRILSFMPNTNGVKIKVTGTSDLIVLGGGFDYFNGPQLVPSDTYKYDNNKNFELFIYETVEFTCINNSSGIKWVISNITTLQNFQKLNTSTGDSPFALLSDRFI